MGQQTDAMTMRTMLSPLLALSLSLTLFSLAGAECPPLEDIPLSIDNTTFTCARIYQGAGDDDVIQSCNTCEEDGLSYGDMGDYQDIPGEDGQYIPVGSLMVLPGCTFYGFSEPNYEGNVIEFGGPDEVPNHGEVVLGIYANDVCGVVVDGYRSAMCRCQQAFISCVPEDDYSTVMSCDNTHGDNPVTCEYTEYVGTSYTEEAWESMSVSYGVMEEVQAGLMDVFSVGISVSATTGYDWGEATSQTFDRIKEYRVSVTVDAGTTVTIDQVVGYCDGNDSQTNFFRTTVYSGNGDEMGRAYHARGGDGHKIDVDPTYI